MKKTILIPTDYSVESLYLLKSVLANQSQDDKCNIILLHGVYSSGSITELLFYSKAKLVKSLSNESFNTACEIIKNKYASLINSFRIDVFSGYTQSAFDNYVEANKIDEAYIPENYQFKLNKKKSMDILPFIRKSNLDLVEVDWQSDESLPEKGKVAEVFYNNISA
jgi:hypothetical protein